MEYELSEEDRRKAIDRFDAVGIAAVQLAVKHPQSSPSTFGIGEKAVATRALAEEWLAEASSRRRRHETLLWVVSISALLAAIFSAIVIFQ